MAAGSARGGVLDGVKIDLRRLHDTWMELVFPRQRQAHSVLGRWTPNTTSGKIAYRAWSAVGILMVGILYPLALFGVVTRFYSRRIDTLIAGIGILGVVIVAAVVWGGLTILAHFQLSWEGFLAVAAAGGVATFSAGLAALCTRYGGRGLTITIAYPAAMTAIFLPPVVAALFSGVVGDAIFPRSEDLAIWLLDNVLFVGDLNESIRDAFDLEGFAYVLMWLGISVPLGWLLGLVVSLAGVIRPSGQSSSSSS